MHLEQSNSAKQQLSRKRQRLNNSDVSFIYRKNFVLGADEYHYDWKAKLESAYSFML